MSAKTSGKQQLPTNKDQQSKLVIAQQSEVFQGPVPHPDILRGYEDIVPGAADRILTMAEKEADVRHELQQKALDSDIRDSRLGIIFGFVLVLVCIVAAVAIAYFIPTNGGAIASAVVGAAGIGTVITTMISSTRRNKEEK